MARGNTRKYESYKAAWERIRDAQAAGFPLEAVAIQESLISDRLISFLARPTAPKPLTKRKHGQWPSFKELIDKWRVEYPAGLAVVGYPDLVKAVDQWRLDRNEVLHALAKSDPGTSTVAVTEFLRRAHHAAECGGLLAKAVLAWHKAEKRNGA